MASSTVYNKWVIFWNESTSSSLPSIRAINPPVLVPHMRSKTSHGRIGGIGSRGLNSWIRLRLIWSISALSMTCEEIPRTPPPSRDRIHNVGWFSIWAIVNAKSRVNFKGITWELTKNTLYYQSKVHEGKIQQVLAKEDCKRECDGASEGRFSVLWVRV